MNDLPTLRYEDDKGLRIFSTTDDPDQYIFKVGKLNNLVTQTGPDCTPQELYQAVLEGIEELKAQLTRERPDLDRLARQYGFGRFATVIAWRGEMKLETLRRLEAAEGGLGGLGHWAQERSYEDTLVRSFWLQAEGPDHMTRVRALIKLADIHGLTAPEPKGDPTGGVLYVDATEAEDEKRWHPTD